MLKLKPLKKVINSINLAVMIKKNKRTTKFKVRRGRYLYTFKTEKPDLAKRLTDGLDNSLFEKIEIKKRVVKKAKK